MENITVEKAKLLDTLRSNRDGHRAEFLAAQQVYRERVIAELDRRLEDARAGRSYDTAIRLPVPEDYTKEYDTAIQMVEWALGEEIVLSHTDFERYVLNRWEWARAFAAHTQAYLAE